MLAKIREYINGLSIKKKIIFYSYLVITPILLIISGLLFANNYRTALQKEIDNHIVQVKGVEDSLEVLQNDVTDFSTSIYVNYDVLKILTASNPFDMNQDSELWKKQAPVQILQDIMALKGFMKTIAIYPENGVIPYRRCIDASAYQDDLEKIRATETYREAVAGKGKAFWKRVPRNSKDIYQTNRSDKLVLYREIYDLALNTPLGYLVIGTDADIYINICKNAIQQKNEGILILSPQGEELIRYGEIDEAVVSYLQSDEVVGRDYRKRESHVTYGAYHVYSSQKNKNGFIVCKMVPKDSFASYWQAIAFQPLLLLLGFLGGLLPVLMFVSNIISKPLGQVCEAMGLFKNGDFDQQVEVNTQDEVGEVAACFNQMVLDIKSLIENNYVMALREKESELMALQAQINPHFLYNTLDSLYWQAQNAGNEEIAEDILALSNLFRLVLGQGKGIITVADEQALITQYLQIQKMRFSKLLDYNIEIQEEIGNATIPKLILQPFVENAVVHGFENAGKACYLTVKGYVKGDMIEFIIKDTGIGMTAEQINEIWQGQVSKKQSSQKIGRYAVKNVKERLQLRYHDDFQLIIESEPGCGTVVTMQIPRGEIGVD